MTAVREKKLLVLCPYPQGVAAGQRLKYEQQFDHWRAQGFSVYVSSFFDLKTWNILYEPGEIRRKGLGTIKGYLRRLADLFRVPQYDIVYIFMWVTPFGTSMFERLVRFLAKKTIFDVEDNVLTDQNLPASYNPNRLIRFLKGYGKARYLIKSADHVITSSPFLNEFCININKYRSCTYVSSSVNTDNFRPTEDIHREKIPTIGWTGTFSSKIYLDGIRHIFLKLAETHEFKLKVIGNFQYDLPGVDLEVIRWSKEREVADMQSLDIGVYPLPLDEWVLGKSGLKAIQYMAFGIPTVATDVGTTPMIIRHEENGMLVRADDEWIDALQKLIRNPDMRRRLGSTARLDAVANYSSVVVGRKYLDILNQVAEGRS